MYRVSSYRYTSESLGEREMLWEHEPQARTVFPQLFRVLPNFHECRNTKYMFSISFEKQRDEKKENNLLTLIIKM